MTQSVLEPLNTSVNAMKSGLTIIYNKTDQRIDIESAGLWRQEGQGTQLISIDRNAKLTEIGDEEIAKRCKGIFINHKNGQLRILNDPFCTIPLYYKDSEAKFIASSNPQRLIDYRTHPFDPAGVWETILLNNPLWNRTPYKDIKFLPAACELSVSHTAKLRRYWNFQFESTGRPFIQSEFLNEIDEVISQKFANIHADSLVMGISGGNDSRLSAHYLAKHKHQFGNIELMTYAAHPNSNELRYAREVALTLDLNPPQVHLLKDKHYKEALDYVPQWSAGQISNQHCHLTSYLNTRNKNYQKELHLSNYYTDAVFGYECSEPQSLADVRLANAWQIIKNAPNIDKAVKEEMLEDCRLALSPALDSESAFSTLNEFKYIVERNPRFHLSLAFLQNQFMPTVLPFADMDILSLAMSTPAHWRAHKRILSDLLKHLNPRLAAIGSSANTEYFYGNKSRLRNGSFRERVRFTHFRLLNLSSQIISKLTHGHLRFGNPFQTEDQLSIYRKTFAQVKPAILENKALQACIGSAALDNTLADSFFIRNLSARFHLISFHHLSCEER